MKKRFLFIALIMLLALALTACSPAKPAEPAAPSEPVEPSEGGEPSVGMPNPFIEVADYDALLAACPGFAVVMPPQGSSNVKYSYAKGEGDAPDFAQVDFSYGQDTYQYRCKPCASEAEADDTLHGYYYDSFTGDETVTLDNGLSYRLRTYDSEGVGVATWYSAIGGCQYSLTTQTSQDPATVIAQVAGYIVPINVEA